MSSTKCTMWCWQSTRNPSTADLGRLVTQGTKLIDAARSQLNDKNVFLMLSMANKPDRRQTACIMGTAVFFPAYYPEKGLLDKNTVSGILTSKAWDLRLDYGNFIAEDKESTQSFTSEELQRIFAATNSSSDWVVTTARAAAAGVPARETTGSFQIADWRIEGLRNARGADIEELRLMLSTVKSWKDGKSAWSTLLMIASGVAIISSAMQFMRPF